jgi:hypothetical protein
MIAVLLPVLGRAHQIEQVLRSLRDATTNEYRPILICSPEDEALPTARAADAELLVASWSPGKADYAKKLALGYRETDEPWIFQGATDLIFYPNWDMNAFKSNRRFHAGVIGTNDMGNPFVMRGLHSTHSLISREYIEKFGGTLDGSGVIFSEAYDHQWSDCEFIETARRRRQFYMAKNARVEHLHPHWGKGAMDPTYDKALRATSKDQKLFMQRRGLYRKYT